MSFFLFECNYSLIFPNRVIILIFYLDLSWAENIFRTEDALSPLRLELWISEQPFLTVIMKAPTLIETVSWLMVSLLVINYG